MVGIVCELTPKCNLNCIFCYNTWRDPAAYQPTPLPPEAFAKILVPTLQQANAQWLAFAGGEPLLYPGLEVLMQHIKAQLPHVKMGLLSNGTALSEKRLAGLVQCGLHYVELSLFASSAQRYQALTGADMLERAHAAILRVKAQGLILTVACTLLADGLGEFEDTVLTAMALGADAFAINPFTPTGYGQARQDELGLSQQQLIQFLNQAQALAQSIPIPLSVTLPIEDCIIPHSQYPDLHFSRCECAVQKWVVDPEGYLRTCEQNQARIGNLATHSFTELSTSQSVKCFQTQNRKPECVSCNQYAQCGGGCRFRES